MAEYKYTSYHSADDDYRKYINRLADSDPTNSTTIEKRELLSEAARAAGAANQAAGAALRPDIDRRKYRGRAASFAERYEAKGIAKIRQACAKCALTEMCPLTPEQLMENLGNADSTRRITFSKRLERDNNNSEPDNLLCDDYLAEPRIKKSDRIPSE